MGLHEEFKLYENMWESLGEKAITESLPVDDYRVVLADYESDDFDINVEFDFQDPDEPDVENMEYLLKPGQTKGDLVVYLSEDCGYTSIYVHDERPASAEDIERLKTSTFPTTGRGDEWSYYGDLDERLSEAYTHYSFDFETEVDYYGALYCARELTYSLVYDPKTAARLYNYAAKAGGWDTEELAVLGDLIGDALESANYHHDIDDYARSYNPFPYWKSTKASNADKAKIDALLTKYKTTADRHWLLWEAINAALYRY